MGKGAKKVLGFAAAIVVPWAAPKILGAFAASAAIKGTALATALSGTVGATLGSAVVGAGLGAVTGKALGLDPRQMALMGAIGGGIGGYASATSPTTGAGAPPTAEIASQSGAVTPTAPPTAGLTTPPVAPPVAAPTPTFMEALKGMPAALAEKFSDPKALADLTLRAAGQLAGSAMAGDGLSPEEKQLLDAQMQDLQRIREQDESLFRTKLEQATALLGEAKYFDPQYFGLKAQREVQIAGAQQMRELERQTALTPGRGGMSPADFRRAALDITARGQSAYARGAEGAQTQRLQAYQAGLNTLPGTPTQAMTLSQGLMRDYEAAYRRQRELAGDIGSFFGDITGTQKATSTGEDRNIIGR